MIFDKSQNLMKLREIQAKKEEIQEKIAEINYRIKNSIETDKLQTMPNKERVKDFINNFERDKEIIEIRAKKYYNESKRIQLRMNKDIKTIIERKKKEIEEEEENIKKQKNEYIEKFRSKEKEIEDKRYKDCKKRALLFQSFSFNKPKTKEEECLFNIRTEKFLRKEEKYFKKEKNKRKDLIKSLTKKELEDFSRSYDNYKDDYYRKSKEKQKELFLQWKKRKDQLPSFMSSYFEIAEMELKKNLDISKENKEKIECLIKNKKDYSQKIKEENKPKIDEKLKKKKLDEIFKRENPKLAVIQDSLLKRKKEKIVSHSISVTESKTALKKIKGRQKSNNKSVSSKKVNNIKHIKNIFAEINKSEIINKQLIHKPIKIKFVSPQPLKTTDEKTNKNIDNTKIDHMRKMYTNKLYKINDFNSGQSISVEKKSENKIHSNNIMSKKNNKTNDNGIMNNIELVKKKADYIEKEADRNEKILKLNGGISNNPKLGKKVSNLLINSIHAKISILNQINNQI
jgi:hypothetical protein